MLKLMYFPRGNNRNRPLKQRLPGGDFESPQELERLFRRFWRERQRGFGRGLAPGTAEEASCV